jgi:hypothetical protein
MSRLERIRSYFGLFDLDLVKLALLVAITVVAFGFTRTLATRT